MKMKQIIIIIVKRGKSFEEINAVLIEEFCVKV